MPRTRTFARFVTGLLLLAALGSPARAQLGTGSLVGTVTDGGGRALPGARLTLSGVGEPRQVVSDAGGRVRALDLAPGLYTARVELAGFAPLQHKALAIVVGRPTAVQFQLSPIPGESITVTAEPPTLAANGFSPALHFERRELESVPTARDPWALAALTPGVLTAAVNAGGSESGAQMWLVGPGTAEVDNSFVLDGVLVTDLSFGGLSSLYYDFDQFETVSVSTGTNDPRVGLGGIVLNMETRRGAGASWRGSLRYLLSDGEWQGDPAEGDVPLGRLDRLGEWGAESGGPLLRDHLWLWASYGRSDVARSLAGGMPTRALLDNASVKVDAQFGDATSAALVAHRGERSGDTLADAMPTRAAETVRQESGPLDVAKLEATRLFGEQLVVSGTLSLVRADIQRWPRAGLDGEPQLGADGVWRGGFRADSVANEMPAARLDASWTLGNGTVGHRLLFGGGARRFDNATLRRWGPRDLYTVAPGEAGAEYGYVQAFRRARDRQISELEEGWLQDTLRLGRLSVGVGVRYERQHGRLGALHAEAHPVFPEILQAVDAPGRGSTFDWRGWAPRLGFTWALDRQGRTLLRGGYARFSSLVTSALLWRTGPAAATALFAFTDLDGDGAFDGGEPTQLLSARGFDAENPSLARPNITDPRLAPEGNHSLDLGLDRELAGGWRAGVDLRYRRTTGVFEVRGLVRDAAGAVRPATRDDYQLDFVHRGTLPDGSPFEAPLYSLAPGLKATGGTLLTNGDRERVYRGATLRAERRMDPRWMLRAHLTVSDWTWRLGPEFHRHDDPTDAAPGLDAEGLWDLADGEGDAVAEESGTSSIYGATSFPNSRWTFAVSGLVRVAPGRPWAFNLAGALTGREGFLLPYDVLLVGRDGRRVAVQATEEADAYRYPDVYQVNLRLERELQRGNFRATLGLDVFNLLDDTAPLLRQRQLNQARANQLLDAVGARTVRLGLRLGLR